MPGGAFDSSKTRVAPVFGHLQTRHDLWIPRLLHLPQHGAPHAPGWDALDLTFVKGCWGEREARLPPPVSLLSWLLRNPKAWGARPDTPERERLAEGDPATVADALSRVGSRSGTRAWYLLEGATVPDVYIETSDAILVIEGKRTESGPTIDTKWLPGRHQMWRHIDAAWERAGRRRVFGFFIVESTDQTLPTEWSAACDALLSAQVLASSFPHRSGKDVKSISGCFLGLTTWQRVCAEFDLPDSCHPDRVTIPGA